MESNFRRGVWVQFRDLVVDPGGRRISKALKDSTFRGLYIILFRGEEHKVYIDKTT